MDWLNDVKRSHLSNGMTVLMRSFPASSAVALHFCVKAGYFCETDEEVGLAHLLEHMYFKGSEKFPVAGTLGILMKELGGTVNASTAYDQTNYYCEIPAENLTPALEIMSDGFVSPIFPEDELRKECEVVIEEFNRKLDSPGSCSLEKLLQLAYTKHRMKRWRIGTPEQLRSFTRDNLFDYFYRYYQPQNMITTIAGNFEEGQVLSLLESRMSVMKNQHLIKDFGPPEPEQNGFRYASHLATATQSFLHFGFHVPGVLSRESAALEFLTFLMTAGRSSRLHRFLVEQKQVATSASCSYLAYEDVGLLMLSCVTESGKIRDCAQNTWAVVSDLLKHGIPENEMQKVQNKLLLHQAMQTEDILNVAELLSYYEAYGGFERIETFLNQMKNLQPGDILKVAEKYMTQKNLSVLEFMNEQIEELSSVEYQKRLDSEISGPMALEIPAKAPRLEDFQLISGNVNGPVIHQGQATYILHVDPLHPFIACGIYFLGGRNEERRQQGGITNLLFRTALKGTRELNSDQISFRLDALGNPPRFQCFRDYSGFSFETLPDSFLPMCDLFMHCLSDSQFPESELAIEKSKMLSAIRRNLDDNFVRPMQLLQKAYYADHPYGIPETGSEESIESMRRQDLFQWKEHLWNKKRMVIALVGSFDRDRLVEHFETKLASWNGVTSDFLQPPAINRPARREESENRQKKQTAFALGFPGPTALHPDIHKYEVLQQVLSGMGGRLFLNLRSKQSLAYTVYAACVAGLYSGLFLTYLAGEASKEDAAIQGMWNELKKLQQEPARMEEIQNAQNALIGSYILNTQTASSKIGDYISCYVAKRPIPYLPVYRQEIRIVSAEDLQIIANRTFYEDNSSIGIVKGTTAKTDTEKLFGV